MGRKKEADRQIEEQETRQTDIDTNRDRQTDTHTHRRFVR